MDRRQFVTGVTAAAAVTHLDPARPSPRAGRLIVNGLDTSVFNDGFVGLLRTGGVHAVHKSMGDEESYALLYAFLAQRRDVIVAATTVREIRDAHAGGRIAVVFGVQDANLIERHVPKSPFGSYATIAARVQRFHDLGGRIHGLCYNVTNLFGGGCMDPTVPLTRAGRRLVEEIHKRRILLDVAGHTGEQTSLDALAMSSGVPVVCTHTNVAALNPNARATTDRVLEAIARTGGVVGVTAISDFHMRNPSNHRAHGPVSPQASLEVHLDQYDYLKRHIGVDHIGLGPDFVWGWGETFDHRAEESIAFPPEALSNGRAVTVKDFEDIAKLPNLIRGLERRGWTETELDRLLGANWLRVYERVWGA